MTEVDDEIQLSSVGIVPHVVFLWVGRRLYSDVNLMLDFRYHIFLLFPCW